MPRNKDDFKHTEGAFAELVSGDLLQVLYHGDQVALVQIVSINRHSLAARDGNMDCKITIVSEKELRFYTQLGPNRESILRNVNIRKVTPHATYLFPYS